MQRCAFTPYEGKKPYIFISYAHKDSDRVFPILEELDRRGYRVWYDDGIAPGSEWPENIAQHLSDCSLTMAFISPSSIASDNCRREVTFALSKRKPFLGIILQPTEMSLGMEMQLSAQQCIMKYTYTSDDAFYQKVCSCPDLAPCLGQPKAAAVPPAPAADIPAAPVKPQPEPKPVKEKKPLDKKMLGIIGGAAAALVILAVILIAVLSGGDKPETPPEGTGGSTQGSTGGQTDPEDTLEKTELRYSDQTITAEDVAYINQQQKLELLEMSSCTIQAGAFAKLQLPASLTEVRLVDCTGVDDLTSLGDLNRLVTLEIRNCDVTDAALPDRLGEKLVSADFTGNPSFGKLEMFSGCAELEELYFPETAVASVDCLAALKNLRYVDGSVTQVTDITPLAGLPELRGLYFAGCSIRTVDAVFSCLRLEELDLSFNLLEGIEAFANCTTLRSVDLSFNDLYEIEILEKSALTLEHLNVSCAGSIYEWDLDFLSGCAGLKELRVDFLNLGTLSFISGNTGLEKLSAVNCGLKNAADIQNLTGLTYLNLGFNGITDVSPLRGLSGQDIILDLSFNDGLENLSAITDTLHLDVLNLTGGQLDPGTLPALRCDTLVLYYHDSLTDSSCLASAEFEHIAIVGCPADRIVSMENRFGADCVTFLADEAAYLAYLEELGIDCASLYLALQ